MSTWKEGTGHFLGDDHSTYMVIGADGKPVGVFVRHSTLGRGNSARQVTGPGDVLVVVSAQTARDRDKSGAFVEVVLEEGKHGWWEVDGSHKVFSAEKPAVTEPPPAARRQPGVDKAAVKAAPKKAGAQPSSTRSRGFAGRSSGTYAPAAGRAAGRKTIAERLLAKFDVLRGPGDAVVFADHRTPRQFATPSSSAPKGLGHLLWSYLDTPGRASVIRTLRESAVGEVPGVAFHTDTFGEPIQQTERGWQREGRPQLVCTVEEGARVNLNQAAYSRMTTNVGLGFNAGSWQGVLGFLDIGATAYLPLANSAPYVALVRCAVGEEVNLLAVVERENGEAVHGCIVRHSGSGVIVEPYPDSTRRYLYDELTGQVLDLYDVL